MFTCHFAAFRLVHGDSVMQQCDVLKISTVATAFHLRTFGTSEPKDPPAPSAGSTAKEAWGRNFLEIGLGWLAILFWNSAGLSSSPPVR